MWIFIRRCLTGGLLVWLPLLATLFVLRFIVNLMDSSLSMLPANYQPQHLLGLRVPGLGVILAVFILFLTGLCASNFIGKKLVILGEHILNRIPFVRTIHSGVKQMLETVLTPSGQSFRQVLLVPFPHPQSFTLGFLVGKNLDLSEHDKQVTHSLLSVFVPTTPNPTSGYLLLIPEKDAITLDMTVDDALKFIISLGTVKPKNKMMLPEE